MGIEVEVRLLEDQRFEIVASTSGARAYIDNKREGYTPSAPNSSELFLASLGGCMVYYARKYLTDLQIDFTQVKVRVSGEWQKRPLMIANIKVEIYTDAQLGERTNNFLRFVHNCPVHNTIVSTQEIKIELRETD